MYDVVIIGGNLAGSSAAIYASSKGLNVALVERNKQPFQPAHCGEAIHKDTLEYFNLNSAKSFLGKNVNLHLKDGAVIVNVQLINIKKGEYGKRKLVEYAVFGKRKLSIIPLRNIAWAELLNLNLIRTAG